MTVSSSLLTHWNPWDDRSDKAQMSVPLHGRLSHAAFSSSHFFPVLVDTQLHWYEPGVLVHVPL